MLTLRDKNRRCGDYLIRPGTRADREAFVQLRSEVFGTWPKSAVDAVFNWKYIDNPYTDDIPLVVAERDGEIVGAYGQLVFERVLGDEPVVGLQGTDAIVHPDHQGRGLFTGMVTFGYDCYRSERAIIQYGFPLSDAREILMGKGLRRREVTTSVFFHPNDDDWIRYHGSGVEPKELLKAGQLPLYRIGIGSVKLAARIAGSIAGLTKPSVTVTKHEDPPTDELYSLYDCAVPTGVHARRNEPFYDYRLRDPRFQFTTYVARTNGRARAAVITSLDVNTRREFVVREVLPFEAESGPLRVALSHAVADRPQGCNVKAWCPSGRRGVLFRSGFVPMSVIPSRSDRKANPLIRSPDARGSEDLDGDVDTPAPVPWSIQAIERDF